MNDWKQEIAESIRRRCDHGPGSLLVGAGCPRCQNLFAEIMIIMDRALDGLSAGIDESIMDSPSEVVRDFRRSIPGG